MDISTTYLGLKLKNPIVPSASPLMEKLENVKRMEDAGAGAVVLHSLFEEQITNEALQLHYHTTAGTESFAEALTYFPDPGAYKFGGDEYVEYVRKVKQAVGIPVIGSLNGVTTGGWTQYARHIQDAGADAIELNLYFVPTDPNIDGAKLENAYLDVLKAVRAAVTIPVAVKISPFFTSLPNMAKRFADAGAGALVLFNRFYQPDMDIESLKVYPHIILSDPHSIRRSLRWIAILHGRVNLSLAATGGVHTATDVLKLLMAGADVTMMCSALYKNGVSHITEVLADMQMWLVEREYESVAQLKGSLSQKSVADPAAFERALYLKELQSFR